jgi:methylisocitrate lyase
MPSLPELLAQDAPVLAPGVYDTLSALIAERSGFPALFVSGYGLAASRLAQPDFGFVTPPDLLDATEQICRRVRVPVVVDIDTGFGGPFNVERLIESLLARGAAGCLLEDQEWPKRCGHMERKRVVSLDEYLPKLAAALARRRGTPFQVIARTDARAVLGLDAAIERAQRFRDAGADIVFVEAPESEAELVQIRREVPGVVLLANMVERGKTPLLPATRLYELGYRLIAAPVAPVLAVTRTLERVYDVLRQQGTTQSIPELMMPFDEFNDLLGLSAYYAREQGFRRPEGQREAGPHTSATSSTHAK